jgi:hypothetical protein
LERILAQEAFMEIGPINAIRPAAAVRSLNPAPDLTGVFAVEFRQQQGEDTYASRRAARGLEDENADEEGIEAEPEYAANDESPAASISFFV